MAQEQSNQTYQTTAEVARTELVKKYQSQLKLISEKLTANNLKEAQALISLTLKNAQTDLETQSALRPFLRSVRAQAYEAEARIQLANSPLWSFASRGDLEGKGLLKNALLPAQADLSKTYKKAEAELVAGLNAAIDPGVRSLLSSGLKNLKKAESELKNLVVSTIVESQKKQIATTIENLGRLSENSKRSHESRGSLDGMDYITRKFSEWTGQQRVEDSQRQNDWITYKQAAFRKNELENFLNEISCTSSYNKNLELKLALDKILSTDTRYLRDREQKLFKQSAALSSTQWDAVHTNYEEIGSSGRTLLVASVAGMATAGMGTLVVGAGWGTAATVTGLGVSALTGTGAGVTSGTLLSVAQAESAIAHKSVTRSQAYSEFGKNLAGDFKTAGITSVATATGLAAARYAALALGEGGAASTGGKTIIALTSSGVGSTTSTTLNVAPALASATYEFIKSKSSDSLTSPDTLSEYAEYLRVRKLSFNDVAKRYFVSVTAGMLGGAVAVRGQAALSSATTAREVVMISSAQQVALAGVGVSVSLVENNGELKPAEVLNTMGRVVIGFTQGRAAVRGELKRLSQETKSTPPLDQSQTTPPPSNPGGELVKPGDGTQAPQQSAQTAPAVIIKNNPETTVKVDPAVVSQVSEILRVPPSRLSFEAIPVGLTNKSFIVTAVNTKSLLRINDPNGVEIGIDRVREYRAHNRGAQLGISPKLIYGDEKILLSNYVDGYLASTRPNLSHREMKTITAALSKFHRTEANLGGTFSPMRQAQEHISAFEKLGGVLPSRFVNGFELASGIQRKLDAGQIKITPCHNDFTPQNLIFAKGKAMVFDWETARNGNPLYDLGKFAYRANMNPFQTRKFVQHYDPTLPAEVQQQVFDHGSVALFLSSVWQKHQSLRHPDSAAVHESWANIRLNQFLKRVGAE